MKKIVLALVVSTCFTTLFSCTEQPGKNTGTANKDLTQSKQQIADMLDSFNVAAGKAEFERYFNFYTEDATFNGTDASENWNKASFKAWAKPFFDAKTTWNFTTLNRNIYFGKHADIAWFEELLSTQMKICRGSGVVVKQGNDWKLQQYVLSTTIPNSILDSVIKIKGPEEDSIMMTFRKK